MVVDTNLDFVNAFRGRSLGRCSESLRVECGTEFSAPSTPDGSRLAHRLETATFFFWSESKVVVKQKRLVPGESERQPGNE